MTEEVSDEMRYEALYESIRNGNHNEVKTFFQNEGEHSLNWLTSCSWPPLLEAAAHGQTDILWDLIHEYGYDANDSFELESHCEEIYGSGKDRQEEHSLCRGTALTLALEFGHWPTAALLISEGADVNAMFYGESAQTYNSFGYELFTDEGPCLYLALRNNAPNRIIQLMQANGLDVDEAWGDYDKKDTLLGLAIRDKKPELVSKLLELGADPNQTVRTPHECHLHTLCYIIHRYVRSQPVWLEIIRLLIDHGADNDYEADNDNEDCGYDSVYKEALAHGDDSLIVCLGLVDRVVKELTELKMRPPETQLEVEDLPIEFREFLAPSTANAIGQVENSLHASRRIASFPVNTFYHFEAKATSLIYLLQNSLKSFGSILLIVDNHSDAENWLSFMNFFNGKQIEQQTQLGKSPYENERNVSRENVGPLTLDHLTHELMDVATIDITNNLIKSELIDNRHFDFVFVDTTAKDLLYIHMSVLSELDPDMIVFM